MCHFINKTLLTCDIFQVFYLLCVHGINNIYISVPYIIYLLIQYSIIWCMTIYCVRICVLININYVKVSWTVCVYEWGILVSLTTSLPVHTGREVTSRTRAEFVTILQCLVESVHLWVPSRGIDSLPVLVYHYIIEICCFAIWKCVFTIYPTFIY